MKIKKFIAWSIWIAFISIAAIGYWVTHTNAEILEFLVPAAIAFVLVWAMHIILTSHD